jgi:RNA polymerase sigma factor (sigma-70 family)
MDDVSVVMHQDPWFANETAAGDLARSLILVGNGDRAAFEDVYRLTSAKLFGVCLRILPDRPRAEDALQGVYYAVWRNASRFDGCRGTAMTWLITIARNRAVDELRRSKDRMFAPIAHAADVPDGRPLASERIEAENEHLAMRRCLDRLSARDAAALREAFFGGSTYADLAASAAIPIGTMKSRIRRALLQLRSLMIEAEGGNGLPVE